MKRFTNTEASVVIDAADAADLITQAKTQGITIGKKPAQELWDGKRDNAGGFEFLEDLVEEEEGAPEPEVTPEPAAPKASDADEKPAFVPAEVDDAVKFFLENGGHIDTTKKIEPAAPVKVTVTKDKAIKPTDPKGKIKPVRKGTKIANGLETLLGGATMEELLAANIGDDPFDFVNRRVTKRGYGIALVEGKISLVLPEGAVGIAYSG